MGLSYEGDMHRVANVEFLYDLTFEQDNEIVQEKQIVERVKSMIKEAEEFIVFDMFLFNDKYDEDKEYPEITDEITKALLEKKEQSPNIEITFITDDQYNISISSIQTFKDATRKRSRCYYDQLNTVARFKSNLLRFLASFFKNV